MAKWEQDVLKRVGAPVTPQNLKLLRQWQAQEGGWTNNDATYNPLNTTHGPGRSINSVGVKQFADYNTGMDMTAQTIMNGRYPNLVKGLRSGNPYQFDISGDLSTWVSGSRTKGLSYAQRVTGGKGAVSRQIPSQKNSGVQGTIPAQNGRSTARKQAAQGLLGFALNYAKTGEINNDELATAVNAVSRAGSVEPPTRAGSLPRSKGRGEVGNGVVDKVLAQAHTQVGKPYVFGSGPNTDSFDCSDLVQWAYKQVGIDIPRTTYEQMKVLPKKSWKNLAPGDLLYKNNGGHVVMYVGGGKVIAAPYTGTVVQYQPLQKFKGGDYHVRSVV